MLPFKEFISPVDRNTNHALQIQALSFTLDNEEDEEDEEDEEENTSCNTVDTNAEICEPPVKKKIRKNPDVDTSFLPDREREDEENRLREEYRQVRGFFFMAVSTRLHRVSGRMTD
jgi:protein FAM50